MPPSTLTRTNELSPKSHEVLTPPSLARRSINLVNGYVIPLAARDRSHRSHTEKLTFATQQAVEHAADLTDNDRHLLSLTGQSWDFINAAHALDSSRSPDSDYTKQHIKELKLEHVIPFNHTLKDVINENPSATLSDLRRTLVQTYRHLFANPHRLNESERQNVVSTTETSEIFRRCIDGMRHEIAAETLLSATDTEYNYQTSVADDARGIDLLVRRGDDWIGIDVKCSANAALRSNGKNPRSMAVWTGLTDEDFRGTRDDTPGALTIPYRVAIEKAPAFINRIDTQRHVVSSVAAVSTGRHLTRR